MLTLPTSLRVFAHRFATDMRKSFSGLVGLIESELGQQVESGHLFLFFNRRRDRVKILFFTGDGLMILYRNLASQCPPFSCCRELVAFMKCWLLTDSRMI
jgi:transposase